MREETYSEQLPIEIREGLLIETARRAFKEGVSYASIVKRFATEVFPLLKERIDALELNQSEDLTPPLYLRAKREYFETKAWIDLNFQVYKEFSGKSAFKEESEIAELLDRQKQRIERHAQKAFDSAYKKFPTSYSKELVKIDEELDRILVGHPEKLAMYSEAQKAVFFEKINTSKRHLREIADWTLQERSNWFKRLMSEGRGFYITRPEKWPYSLIYTLQNTLYIALETPEHFLGIGEGKIICRTIDLQKGKLLALVKPRIIFSLEKEPRTEQARRIDIFDYAWRESNFLIKLRGKKGIIEVGERIVFKIHEKQHLFLIEERYEDSNLFHSLIAARRSGKDMNFKTKAAISSCILQGLVHIHEANILHRDIKPQNVLLDLSHLASINAVICDFNAACYMDEKRMLEQQGFSPVGCPPEYARAILSMKKDHIVKATTAKMDIWAMGILMCFIFFEGVLPWLVKKELQEILSHLATLTPDWVPETYKNHPLSPFILKMLSIDPHRRPTAIEAYEEFGMLIASAPLQKFL